MAIFLSAPHRAAGAALAFALTACSSSPPPAPAPLPGPSAAESASAIPSAAPIGPATPASAAPEIASPFFVAYEQPYPGLRVFPLGKLALAIVGEPFLGRPLRVDDAGVREDPTLFKGLEVLHEAPAPGDEDVVQGLLVFDVEGNYPSSGTLSANVPGDRGGTDHAFRLAQGVWKKIPEVPRTKRYNDAYYLGGLGLTTAWTGGRLLYEVYATGGNELDYDGAAAGVTIPRFAKAPAGVACTHRIRKHFALVASSAQELFGAGQICVPGDEEPVYLDTSSSKGPLAVERWARGSKTSTIDTLPDQPGLRAESAHTLLQVRSGSDVLFGTTLIAGAAETPYLAHFDGSRWRALPTAAIGSLEDIVVRGDGSLWIQVGSALWRRPSLAPDAAWTRITEEGLTELRWWKHTPDGALWLRSGDTLRKRVGDGAWELVPLPTRDPEGKAVTYTPDRLAWVDGEAMIISDPDDPHEGSKAALLRTRKPTSVAHAAPDGAPKGAPARIVAATAACKDPFVLLYKLARTAPVDYDFPLTREALKGHTELGAARLAETEEAGRRYLVAFVPTLALGQKVVKVVGDKVPSARPQLLCGKPKVKRALQLDYRTGNLVK